MYGVQQKAKFGKRHYTLIAEQLKDASERTNSFAIRVAVDNLTAMFKKDNPSFNELKFIEACGYDGVRR